MANQLECLLCPGDPANAPRTGRRPILRRGFTLIELLVVISIMMLLVVITVPGMRPAMEARRIREAARAVNVYFGAARGRAIGSGHAVGVAIVRDGNMPLAGLRLIQVEVPPPYAGDVDNAAVRVQDWTYSTDTPGLVNYWPDGSSILKVQVRVGDFSPGLLRLGDTMRLAGRGPDFTIIADLLFGGNFPLDGSGYLDFSQGVDNNMDGWVDNFYVTLRVPPRTVAAMPWQRDFPAKMGTHPDPAKWSFPVAFQVTRQPVTSAIAPLILPKSVVIDLWYSGTPSAWFAGPLTGALSTPYPTIMFSSSGSVTEIAADTLPLGRMPAAEPIYLLVGRRDRVNPDPTQGNPMTHLIPATAEDGGTNADDLANLWVAINPQTGYVVCAEMAADDPATPDPPIVDIRRFAREFQALGGR